MAILSDEDRKAIQQHFSTMEKPVYITLTHPSDGPGDSGAILKELAGLSNLINLEINPSTEETPPVITIGDHGRVQFLGTPSGYEFSTLLTAIIDAGRTGTKLSQKTTAFLDALSQELDIMVFVTPTCPHCPGAGVLAHRMAAASNRVTSRVIEAQEYSELAREHRVMGVPRTVINGRFFGEGNMGESVLVGALSKAMTEAAPEGTVNLSDFTT